MKNFSWNKIGKDIFVKFLVFLFCVAFISLNNYLLGQNNSIAGVILLVGLFLLMKGDLGFDVRQASFSIVFMFGIIAFCPKLAAIHPLVGLVVNSCSILLIMILSSHDVTMSNHTTFMLGYLFCQGYDVTGKDYALRVVGLLVGGIVIALLYYLANQKKEYKRNIKDLFDELYIHSTRTRWYVKLTFLLSVTMFVCDLLQYPKTMWISLTILSLTLPFEEEYKERRRVRIPAAICGTALFYILFEMIVPLEYQPIVVLFAGFLAMFIKNYFLKCIYNSFSALGTAVLIFSTKGAITLRILSNIIGTIIVIAGYFAFQIVFKYYEQWYENRGHLPAA
ncbi:MAG: FUSC family protein [bacterium]|nr:FUSC family protein [bacterium]